MKKLITLLFLSFLFYLNTNAQIQRKFYDFTLGVTTKSEFVRFFKAKGIKIIKDGDDQYVVENLRFGGETWPFASFMFFNGKLMRIYFSANEHNKSRILLAQIWEKLNSRIFNKYSDFIILKKSDAEKKVYNDFQTSLTISYDYYEGQKYVTISYLDMKLLLEKDYQEENEL